MGQESRAEQTQIPLNFFLIRENPWFYEIFSNEQELKRESYKRAES